MIVLPGTFMWSIKREKKCKWLRCYLLYHWGDGLQAAGPGRELAVKPTCLHLMTNENLSIHCSINRQQNKLYKCMIYLRELLKGPSCFLVSIWGPSNHNHRPEHIQHVVVKSRWPHVPWLKCIRTNLHQFLYQQFMFELAIPPRAWMSPGPDTTRQAPGLDTDEHM